MGIAYNDAEWNVIQYIRRFINESFVLMYFVFVQGSCSSSDVKAPPAPSAKSKKKRKDEKAPPPPAPPAPPAKHPEKVSIAIFASSFRYPVLLQCTDDK